LSGGPAPQLESAKPEPAKITKVAAPTTKEELDDAIPF
jgi:hypothetical protein